MQAEKARLRPLKNDVTREIRVLEEQETKKAEERDSKGQQYDPSFQTGTNIRLQKLNSVWDQRLGVLERDGRDRDTVTVIRWLENGGQKRFQHKIFAPPIMSVGLNDKAYANIVNTSFRKQDLMVPYPSFPQDGLTTVDVYLHVSRRL